MIRIFVSAVIISLICPFVKAVDITFVGNKEKVIKIIPEKSTGLNELYVAYDVADISEMIVSGLTGKVEVSRYSNLGGGFAENVDFNYSGNDIEIKSVQGDMGYIFNDSAGSTYIWLVDYAKHMLSLGTITESEIVDCDNTRLEISGTGGAIYYYTIDGRPVELDRDIELSYHNLEWSEDSDSFVQKEQIKILNHLTSSVMITPPLYCNSTFELQGDRFLQEWGKGQKVTSGLIYANGVDARTFAVQTNVNDGDDASSNIIKTDVTGMGGSAPVDIEFTAYTTDAVIHNEWQITTDETFEYIDYRFNEQNIDYSFNDEGTYYARFIGSNSDGTCEVIGDVFTISVGASELRIPNAFTPNGDGVNDEWKVAYRSLIKFKCSIFDRYGNELFKFDDPSQGWDGKYKGKDVNPGVYFYVIEAEGADGKKYKKGGDINIVKSKKNGTSQSVTM